MRYQKIEDKKQSVEQKLLSKLHEQQDNFDLYKGNKETKMTRIKSNLAIVKATDNKRTSGLMQKVNNDGTHIEQFKAQQETNKNLKQELHRLKDTGL